MFKRTVIVVENSFSTKPQLRNSKVMQVLRNGNSGVSDKCTYSHVFNTTVNTGPDGSFILSSHENYNIF